MSSYVDMDHADWAQRNIDAAFRQGIKQHPSTPVKLSEFQKTVVNILGIVGGGIYNAPINIHKVDWRYGDGLSVVWQGHEMATFDSGQLTMLVFLCHEARIRCSVSGCGPRNMRLNFWQRKAEGGFSERHPNLEEAVNKFREWFKSGHSINFGVPQYSDPA